MLWKNFIVMENQGRTVVHFMTDQELERGYREGIELNRILKSMPSLNCFLQLHPASYLLSPYNTHIHTHSARL